MTDSTAEPPTPQSKSEANTRTERVEKPHNFAAFLHRHDRLLTIVGFLLLFATFVIKDAFKEQLKDRLDSLERAKDRYTVGNYLLDIRQHVREIEYKDLSSFKELARYKDLPGLKDFWTTQESQAVVSAILTSQNIEDIADNIQNLEEFMQQGGRLLPSAERLRKTFSDYKRDSAWLATARSQQSLSESEWVAKNAQLLSSADNLKSAVTSFAQEAFQEAEKRASDDARRYEIVTWISYCLYTLGWGLALLGRLVGVEIGAVE